MPTLRPPVRLMPIALVILALAGITHAETERTYEVVFDATWSSDTHPLEFPSFPHFSPPIGVVHTAESVVWREGELASPGIEQIAEQGLTFFINDELLALALDGHASASPFNGAFLNSPGGTTSIAVATSRYDHLSWVSMLAPSPDWFVGVDALPLHENGEWLEEIVIPLYAYDSGTDDGLSFSSPNADAQNPQPITRIVTAPLAPDGQTLPVGTLTVRLIAIADSPIGGDPDGDGLSNFEENRRGSDPLLADTDGDGLLDGSDTCPALVDPAQQDSDADGFGDPCDVCPDAFDPAQDDLDGNGTGDYCDLDDQRIRFVQIGPSGSSWQNESTYDRFHYYRGDLGILRSSAGSAVTQAPNGGAADRVCDLTTPSIADAYVPAIGEGVFYLVTGEAGGIEAAPGENSAGTPRPNPAACSP